MVITPADLNDFDEPIEDGDSFAQNAYIKAKYYHDRYGMETIADDSGMTIRYLNDLPDIHSARFLRHLSYEEKNRLITDIMKDVKDRYAYYTCDICYVDKEEIRHFCGTLEGEIAFSPKGLHGFGYDPIFFIKEQGMTLAQMTPDYKNRISHRSKAIEGLVAYFAKR